MFTLHIETENASFYPNPRMEITAILRELIKRIDEGILPNDAGRLRDSNGNRVGEWNLTES